MTRHDGSMQQLCASNWHGMHLLTGRTHLLGRPAAREFALHVGAKARLLDAAFNVCKVGLERAGLALAAHWFALEIVLGRVGARE
eukprot:6186335-Pleurochrysis_carterae.AAC.1